jgi:hypothetical protein
MAENAISASWQADFSDIAVIPSVQTAWVGLQLLADGR